MSLWCFPFKITHGDKVEVQTPYSSLFVDPGASWTGIQRFKMESLILTKAQESHIDSELLLKIAWCESGLKPNNKNPRSTASGLFQFLNSTYSSYAKQYGINKPKNDPEAQAELAAKMIAAGGINHWLASRSCWQSTASLSK